MEPRRRPHEGLSRLNIVGSHFSIFYTERDIAIGHPQRELDIAEKEGKYAEQGWRVRKDGSQFWASVTLTALRDRSGQLLGFGKVTGISQNDSNIQLLADIATTTNGPWSR